MSLLGLEKSLKFTLLYTPSFFCKITRIILPRRIWLIFGVQEPVKLAGNVKTFLCTNNILFLFLYFKCYFCTSDATASHTQSVLLRKVVWR